MTEILDPPGGGRICLRMDDVGSCSKAYAIYSNKRFGNILWLKYFPPFRAWGPYREMTAQEWDDVFGLLLRAGAKLTVAVTAAWVEKDGSLVPFPDKFPTEAAKLKQGVADGLIEIANHGLTHCVVENGRFLPRAFGSNRLAHREFWDWLPVPFHEEHLERSQAILTECFGARPTTLVPPGNVFAQATLKAAARTGILKVNCNRAEGGYPGLSIVGNQNVLAFHDRELVLNGTRWLADKLAEIPSGTRYIFARDL